MDCDALPAGGGSAVHAEQVSIFHSGTLEGMTKGRRTEERGDVQAQRRVEGEDVQGKVAVLESEYDNLLNVIETKASLLNLQSRGAVGVAVILHHSFNKAKISELFSSLCGTVGIPIMFIQRRDAGVLARPCAKLTAFPGWVLLYCCALFHYLPCSYASSRSVL